MLVVNARKIAVYTWPHGPGETAVYQAHLRDGGGFFAVIGEPPEVTIAPTSRKAAIRWMDGAGIKRLAELRPPEQISRTLKGPGQRKRA